MRAAAEADERLARQVGRIALERRDSLEGEAGSLRRVHADLLRDMLVGINAEYRRRFGTPPPPPQAAPAETEVRPRTMRMVREESMRDVEMIAV